MENSDNSNVMGIMEMSMQLTLWCGIATSLRCLAWDMGQLVGSSPRPVWQHARFNRDYEQEKEEGSSLMEKVALVYNVNLNDTINLHGPFLDYQCT